MLNGAFVLLIATVLVKIIGALYKIPLTAMIGEVGMGYFTSAYEIYNPVYAIAMAGLPIAVSRMVSENVALGRFRDARMIFKVAKRIFLLVGIIGTLFMAVIAFPYVKLGKAPDNIYSIMMIAPSIFFCCSMATYRGYYEGLRNMTPTGVSQVIEAAGKLALGLALSKYIFNYGVSCFEAGKAVFGRTVTTQAEALSAIYPFAAAGAVVGVTVGTMIALLYLMVLKRIKGDGFTREQLVNSQKPMDSQKILKMLITVAIPMVISAVVLNVTNLIDNFTIRTRLAHAIGENITLIKSMYSYSLLGTQTLDSDIGTYLYGSYSTALNLKNLVPMITMTLGISAIPAVAAARAKHNTKEVNSLIESVIRVVLLISLPAGVGMALLAEPILTLLYGGSRPFLIPIAAPIVAIYGWTTVLYSISAPLTNLLQGLGRADIPAKILVAGVVVKVISNFYFVGMPKYNIMGAPIGSVLCHLIIVGLDLFFLFKISKARINLVSTLVKPLICTVCCGIAAYMSYGIFARILPGEPLHACRLATVAAVCIAAAVYLVALLVFRGISREDVVVLPKGEKIAKILEKYGFLG